MSGASATLLASCFVVACSPSAGAPTTPTVCRGIPAEMGGCSAARPSFAGTTCRDVAEEWGRYVDQNVVGVINGPDTADGKKRSVRISDALVLGSIVAGMRLDELGLLSACDVPEFLPAAKGHFSEELEGRISSALFDGSPIATPQDWDAALKRAIGIIDEGE